jgi:hypothetical protein
MMNIGFTKNQELAAERLRAIAPLVHLARQVFISINLLSTGAVAGNLEVTARDKSLALAKSILMLEQDLKRLINGAER